MEAQALQKDLKLGLKEQHHHKAPSPLPLSLPTSPSHEFSFTVSLNPPPNSPSSQNPNSCTTNKASFVVDLAPADDIFYGGQLLPLHFLSHPNIPPRVSMTNTNATNPSINDNLHHKKFHVVDMHANYATKPSNKTCTNDHNKEKNKPTKSLSSFFSLPKSQKNSENHHENPKEEDKKMKKKWIDMTKQLLKKYTNMVETIFLRGEKAKRDLKRRPYSFSGRSNRRDREGWKGKKAQYSAPASLRTSPTNSGLLLASPAKFSTSDGSSMEELQNAIQAAIAHCKNSVAFKEEICKC